MRPVFSYFYTEAKGSTQLKLGLCDSAPVVHFNEYLLISLQLHMSDELAPPRRREDIMYILCRPAAAGQAKMRFTRHRIKTPQEIKYSL